MSPAGPRVQHHNRRRRRGPGRGAPATAHGQRFLIWAKNSVGDLSVAYANRLTDGVVVFLDDDGE